jgi:two-component system, cell cycle sensor histidine kinase and response regulator CckA
VPSDENFKMTEYSSLFQYALDGIILADVNGNIIEANPACGEMLGYSREEILQKKLSVFFIPEDLATTPLHFKEAMEGKTVRSQRRLLRRDGACILVDINGRMLPSGQLLAIFRDISAQKKTEQELRESESQLSNLFDNSPNAIALTYSACYVKVNSIFLEMFGYAREEVIGRSVLDMVSPESRETIRAMIGKRRYGDKNSLHLEIKGRRKNGSEFDLEIDTSVCVMGEKSYSIAHHRDISERKRTEEALNNTQKLEALGVLAGGIAHDFNNLMGGIFGYMDLARCSSKDPFVTEFLEKALGTLHRARALTQQLLTFAKGGAPMLKVGDLLPCVKEAVQFALSGSNVSCDFELPENPYECHFDKNQICQVIDNIVINAQHAMPAGGTLRVAAKNVTFGEAEHPTLPRGGYIRISIRDHGIGIPKELLSRIFDPFFTTKSKGHGLGLATCYSIVKRHGGAIDVESELGKGSVFHVYLPAVSGPGAREKVFAEIRHRGTGNIIVMDDEDVMLDTIGTMLKGFGYTPSFAKNGNEALELFTADTPTNRPVVGIILDLTVPGGMGGKETIIAIRKIDSKIPIFVASGYADDPVMQNPSGFGFTASICKPFTKSELAEMLSNYLK